MLVAVDNNRLARGGWWGISQSNGCSDIHNTQTPPSQEHHVPARRALITAQMLLWRKPITDCLISSQERSCPLYERYFQSIQDLGLGLGFRLWNMYERASIVLPFLLLICLRVKPKPKTTCDNDGHLCTNAHSRAVIHFNTAAFVQRRLFHRKLQSCSA